MGAAWVAMFCNATTSPSETRAAACCRETTLSTATCVLSDDGHDLEPAVQLDNLTRQVVRPGRAEKRNQVGDVLGRSGSSDRDLRHDLGNHVLRYPDHFTDPSSAGESGSFYVSRGDRVHVDLLRAPFPRQRFGQPDHASLGGRIVRAASQAVDTSGRGDVDDLSVVARALAGRP